MCTVTVLYYCRLITSPNFKFLALWFWSFWRDKRAKYKDKINKEKNNVGVKKNCMWNMWKLNCICGIV